MNYKQGDLPVFEESIDADRNDVLICTTHFNPCKFTKLKNTFYEWCKWLGPNINYLKTYELVYDDEKPEILGSQVIRGTREKHVMFQKEALINKCFRDCPNKIKYFVWIDHDFIISDPNWINNAIDKIKGNVKCVQLFKDIYYLGPQGRVSYTAHGRVAYFTKGNPGGAWIASAEFLEEIDGLLDRNIVGGGDQYFIASVLPGFDIYKNYSPELVQYSENYIKDVRSKGYVCSYLDCDAFHIYHGKNENRQYWTRGQITDKQKYDPQKDVIINSDGILEWSSDKPELHRLVKEYFQNRKEDE